jgi:N-acetyl-anhydromuramyl-L-alanine amidase AmpD
MISPSASSSKDATACLSTDASTTRCNRLLAELRRRHAIDAVVGHSDIAPGRKTDPGPHFDWRRIRDVE